MVSQSEVEHLLAQIDSGEGPELEPNPAQSGPPGHAQVKRHVFPPYSPFSPAQLRKLRVRHENFLSSLSARLSLRLHLELALQMSSFEALGFQRVVDGLSQPAHLTLVSFQPLDGICLLEIPPRLGLSIVDRELGGSGIFLEDPRELTQTESHVLSKTVEIIVNEWCASWSGLLDLRPVLLGNENSGRYLHTSRPQEIVLALGIEARLGGVMEQILLALPHTTLQPLMRKLDSDPASSEQPSASRARTPLPWNPALGGLKMRVTAELPSLELSAKVLANLQPGDVLPVPEGMTSQIKLCLHGVPKFTGTLGTCGSTRALELNHLINPDLDL